MSSISHSLSNAYLNHHYDDLNFNLSLAGFNQHSQPSLMLPNGSPPLLDGAPLHFSPGFSTSSYSPPGEFYYPPLLSSEAATHQLSLDSILNIMPSHFAPHGSQSPSATQVVSSPTLTMNEVFHAPSSPSDQTSMYHHSDSNPKSFKKRKASDSEPLDEEPSDLPEDPAARKRRQNTLAARRSRQRKVQKMDELEKTISGLEKDKIQLETKVAVLESEKEHSLRREKENAERIRALEAQLMEALKSNRS